MPGCFETVRARGAHLAAEYFCAEPLARHQTAVVLVAGALEPMVFYDDTFCEKLSLKRPVVRFDNRDFGRSSHVAADGRPPLSIKDMAEDLEALLDHFGFERVHVVGHGMGATIAWLFAATNPRHVVSITAVAPQLSIGRHLPYKAATSAKAPLWEALDADRLGPHYDAGKNACHRAHRRLSAAQPVDAAMSERLARYTYATQSCTEPHSHLTAQQTVPDVFGALAHGSVSLAFIQGSRDRELASPADVALLAEALGGAPFELLPGAGHLFLNHELWNHLAASVEQHMQSAEKNAGLVA